MNTNTIPARMVKALTESLNDPTLTPAKRREAERLLAKWQTFCQNCGSPSHTFCNR